MQVFRNKIWISGVCLFALHQVTQKILHWDFSFIDSYLDPFLCMPILLGLVLQERQFLIARYFSATISPRYCFSILETVIATIFFAIIFEEGFSYFSTYFTKDWWDYLAYFSGSVVFYFLINKTL